MHERDQRSVALAHGSVARRNDRDAGRIALAKMSGDVFAALGDPTRRDLFARLVRSGPTTATQLAGDLEITRQAVAKHLGILAHAGMASSSKVGRETRFEADLASLANVQQWIAAVEGDWTLRLAALAQSLEQSERGD